MTRYLEFVVIDTMTEEPFKGNPTPVFILDHLPDWLNAKSLQKIARELNQSETIFVKRRKGEVNQEGGAVYDIRSFTPYAEEPFCGHGVIGAMIALGAAGISGKVLFRTVDGIMVHAQLLPPAQSNFENSSSGGTKDRVRLLIPAVPVNEVFHEDDDLRTSIANALGISSRQIVGIGRNSLMDLVIELGQDVNYSATVMKVDAVTLMKVSPTGTRSQILTSRGDHYGVDFVKRVFAYGSEDQATGSTHCVLFPYWASKLGKSRMTVKQVSERTGEVAVEASCDDPRYVALTASGVQVMHGKMLIPRDRGDGTLLRAKL